MTRSEFIEQAAISMAAKVIGTNGIAEQGDWDDVVTEAYELADAMERSGHTFDAGTHEE